jgi:hypothetical protein
MQCFFLDIVCIGYNFSLGKTTVLQLQYLVAVCFQHLSLCCLILVSCVFRIDKTIC